MDLKNIIVKEYLESLTERGELNRIFPLLLESLDFDILTEPTQYIGIQEFGKDIVAVGVDEDGIKKRFYFELKGGEDRNITTRNFNGPDGIHESLTESSYNPFVSAYPKFEHLPLKIVIVHNGKIKGSVQGTFENYLVKLGSMFSDREFDRWDISRLTTLFSKNLFSSHLLIDPVSTKFFNRTLVNLNASNNISRDFIELLDYIFAKYKWKSYKRKVPRKWRLLFESLKLISFIIYTESKGYNNLEIAKNYLMHLVIRFWYWILKNKLETDSKILAYFDQVMFFFYEVVREYFQRTLEVAQLKDGLYCENGGRYEQIGYTQRTFDYLSILLILINMEKNCIPDYNIRDSSTIVANIINANSVSTRPLIDINSLAIINIVELFVNVGDLESAKNYVKMVLGNIRFRKSKNGVLPDANNNIESVIKFTVTGHKPVYYSDSTSPLLAVLMEYLVLFDLEEEYSKMKIFIKKYELTLGLFIPHHGVTSTSTNLIEDVNNDLDEQLFYRTIYDGYQVETLLTKDLSIDITFDEFKTKVLKRKNEFQFKYRTDKAGYPFLKDIAHYYYQNSYFPDKWRNLQV